MAKDGTARGGQRVGAGRKSKALTDKIAAGNPGKRKLKVIDLPKVDDLKGMDMPEPREYLKAAQMDGMTFVAEDIYRETWKWIKERGCSEFGFLANHPTTGQACASPYVAMSQSYMKQVNQLWYQIFQVVKENCSEEFKGATPQEDIMETLLRKRG